MVDTDALVARSGDLKEQLVAFALSRRFRRVLDDVVLDHLGGRPPDAAQLATVLDFFLTNYRLKGGRTVVEHFVESHPELTEDERSMLLGWRDAVDGVFQIERREGEALVLFNLIDELTYRVRSNMGPATLRPMKPGMYIVTRIVPVGDEWTLSGYQQLHRAKDRPAVVAAATDTALRRPRLAFRNPEKLEQAWKFQRQDRADFVAFFGTDVVTLPGHELPERYQAYLRFKYFECRGEDGKTIVERVRELDGETPAPPEFAFPDYLIEGATVGLIYDEVDGMHFFPDFGLVEETFADPDLVADRRHRKAVIDYLESPDIIPLPLTRLADRDPARASRVWQQVLKRPRFSWERDGEALLRKYKADYYAEPPLPGIAPIGDSLAADPPAEGRFRRRLRR